MKDTTIRPLLILAACMAFLLGGIPVLSAAEAAKKTDDAGWILPDSALGDNWHLRLKDARAEAAKDDKPILILFTGPDWSSASKKMESSIIRSKEFTASIRPAVVGLYIRHFVESDAPEAQLEAKLKDSKFFKPEWKLGENRKINNLSCFEIFLDLNEPIKK